ncbi:MAG: type II toxin-antitoxin system VapC family toxin [bacterium]
MRFDELPKGGKILLDANIFIYHFTGTSEECSRLLKRCEEGDIKGITAVTVTLEVLHRLMAIEAVRKGLVSGGNVVRKLKEKPEVVKKLSEYYENVQKIKGIGIEIYPLTEEIVDRSYQIRKQYGLLINDSVVVAFMKEQRISNIATRDEDFERVEGIKVYKPEDLKSG